MLDRQVRIYSVDTGDFYSNTEARLHDKARRLRAEKRECLREAGRLEAGLKAAGASGASLKAAYAEYASGGDPGGGEVAAWCRARRLAEEKGRKAALAKERLLGLLSRKAEANAASGGRHHVRALRGGAASDGNVISVFDSSFTRMIGAAEGCLCEDFMVVKIYYFDVMKDLVYFGYTYKGERYVYFTSSAGQIRSKKCVFVKESVWKSHEKAVMCGLTVESINAAGGINPNKYLAYMALNNSATDVWEDFDIDRAIVVDDFETDVRGVYDLVDDSDYSVRRIDGAVPVCHTDGAGMMLPCMGKNRMVRLPWIKGLLSPFPFDEFVMEAGCSPVVRDVYGEEHDVLGEGICVIFTKSMFKLWNHYSSWEDYKSKYKEYGCSAGYASVEEDRVRDARINYQMLQTLTDVTDGELEELARPSVSRLEGLCSSVGSVKAAFGITPYNMDKSWFQKAAGLYPELLNDAYAKAQLREIKDGLVRKYRAGKLQVGGKYAFVLPDFYAACGYWFGGDPDPEGLLADGEVYCGLFPRAAKLDCLRSPHLYKEHAVRGNAACTRGAALSRWFPTGAVYTSCHDLISKVLMFDCDGDKLLVVADPFFVGLAERNMEGVAPLYYNMKKADPAPLDSSSIYGGLVSAFRHSNIGVYSNSISKIWNGDAAVSGTEGEKREAAELVKLLCMENNFCIDAAKTLYMPERPPDVRKRISARVGRELPHFFIYAKGKSERQVARANGSLVNRLEGIVPNPRIDCRKLGLGRPDYRLLMRDPDAGCRAAFDARGRLDPEGTDPLIVRYCELDSKHHFQIRNILYVNEAFRGDVLMRPRVAQELRCGRISEMIRGELSRFGRSDEEIADVLVKYLYGMRDGRNKGALWLCYGGIVYGNLERNVGSPGTKAVRCAECGRWFDVSARDTRSERCPECYAAYRRARKAEAQRIRREAARGMDGG